MKTGIAVTHTDAVSLTIVPETSTHIAFINGKTYTRQQVNAYEALLAVVKDMAKCVISCETPGFQDEFDVMALRARKALALAGEKDI